MTYLILILAIAAEVCGTLALKASEGFSRLWPSVVVVLGYGLAFVLLAQTLRVLPVGIAYAIWSGMGTVMIAAIGWLVFGQRLDAAAICGMTLIVAGVLVINLLSHSAAH